MFWILEFWSLKFVSDFGFRISDFPILRVFVAELINIPYKTENALDLYRPSASLLPT
jgi:hypothetical protein